MMGRSSGVHTPFEKGTAFAVFCIWCVLHQLDLVAQREYSSLADDSYVTTLTGLIAYLARQQNLNALMKTTFPEFVSTP